MKLPGPTRVVGRFAALLLVILTGIGGLSGGPLPAYARDPDSTLATATPIKHAIFIMMENHTFDNMFGQFPGANGITLPQAPDPQPGDLDHEGAAALAAIH